MPNDSLLQVRDLKKYFEIKRGFFWGEPARVHAVDGVSFDLYRGETLGLVGESGCGKSTTGRLILRLIEPTAGEVTFEGASIFKATKSEMRGLRQRMQIIFQDPYSSLNPRMTVEQIVGEGIVIHKLCKTRAERRARVADLMQKVGLSPEQMHRYPHEFSGGQRQRVCIARALIVRPEFLVADEPVSSLDVSVQAQIVNLLRELQKKFRLTYLFISHDLSVVRYVSNRIAIMYLGRIVELATTAEFFANPLHPYSQALLSAVPVPDPDVETSRKRIILVGELPSPSNLPKGCRFSTRCWKRMDICGQEEPLLEESSRGHFTACHLYR
jgi:oligopeptide transport system ATP-binding protein